jgi:hypothetical protein
MVRIFNELKEEFKRTCKNNSMNIKRTQINSRRHRNKQINSRRLSVNSEMKLRRLLKKEVNEIEKTA